MKTPSSPNNKINFNLDLRLIVLALLAVIAGMLFVWKPWTSTASDRTISVTGETTIKAEPDEYLFYPTYEFKGADKTVTLAQLTKKSEEIISKLKSLGVPDSKIKSNTSGYNYSYYYDPASKENTYTLGLTVTSGSREEAQKIQDYLITTAPTGAVSPQANFSEAKRKELQSKARDAASKDARAKAEQSAKNLGAKLGKVKTIEDGAGFGDVYPIYGRATIDSADNSKEVLTVQPGENDLTYSVKVTYYLR